MTTDYIRPTPLTLTKPEIPQQENHFFNDNNEGIFFEIRVADEVIVITKASGFEFERRRLERVVEITADCFPQKMRRAA